MADYIMNDDRDAKDILIELRESTGMNRHQFCEYFEIPYMTVSDWEHGKKRVPKYFLRLLEYYVKAEQMNKAKEEQNNRVITVQGIPVTVSYEDIDDYICITDIAAAKSDNSRAADVIRNWLRNRSTLEFLSTWEEIYNPNFKVFESEHFKKEAGLVTFTPSVSEWVEKTNAVGLYVKRGKYGGTFAHKDIAFEFASAISPVFKLYLIKEFQRLKEAENDLQKLEWDAKRFLSKNNYLIQTDAVKNYLIPVCNYREDLQWLPYAEEADLLNVALFGFTAKAWREANPELAKKSNVRDYATINELTVLSNLESHNAQMIREGMDKKDRFEALKEIAEYQLRVLNEAEKISNRIEEQ